MKATVEAWVSDNVILCIATEEATIRIKMPDGASAMKALETLMTSEDVTNERLG